MRRALCAAGLVALLVMSLGGVAAAGEVKGPPGEGGAEGGPTPIADFWTGDGAASICSFSGLNDEITYDGEFPEPTQTQSYGTFLVLIKQMTGASTHEAKAMLGDAPGDSCNPSKMGNPKT